MKIDKDLERIITYFKGREEVSALYLFGSRAEGRGMRGSDIDLAVLIDEGKMKKKSCDLLKGDYYHATPTFSLYPVDIVILNTAPPFLKHRILRTGRILFDRSRRLRVRFTARAIIEYLDFKPIEDIFIGTVASHFRTKFRL